VILLGLGAGLYWGYRSLLRQVVLPRVDRQLEEILQRSVTLGDLSLVTPTRIRLGPSQIENLGTIAAIEVGIHPGRLLRGEVVGDLLLRDPQLTLNLPLDPTPVFPTADSGGSFPLQELGIKIEGGTVAVVSQGQATTLNQIQIQSTLRAGDASPEFEFQVEGLFQDQPIALEGTLNLGAETGGTILLTGTQLPLNSFPSLAPENTLPPSLVLEGMLDINTQLDFSLQEQLQLDLEGQAGVSSSTLALETVPYPLTDIQAALRFADRSLMIENFQVRYADIPVLAAGTVSITNQLQPQLQLTATVPSLSLARIQQVLDTPLPFPAEVDLRTSVTVSGTWPDLEVRGSVRSTATGQLDQLNLSNLASEFQVDLATQTLTVEQLTALIAGGEIRGEGTIQLGDRASAQAQVQIQNLDLDRLAALYETAPPYLLGTLNAQVQLDAPTLTDPSLTATWQSSGPDLQSQGQLFFQNQQLILPQAQMRFGQDQGTATLVGEWVRGQLQASLSLEAVDLSWWQPSAQGQVSGEWDIRGTSDGWILNTLNADGSLNFPQGLTVTTEQGEAQTPEAQINLNVTNITEALNAGDLQATGQVQLPQGITLIREGNDLVIPEASGEFQLTGPPLNPADLQARGVFTLPQGAIVIPQDEDAYVIPDPIESTLVWDGQRLQLQDNQIGSRARISGEIPLNLDTGEIGELDLEIEVQSLDLEDLPFLPSGLGLAGQLDLNAQVQGLPAQVQVVGDLSLADLEVGGVTFGDLEGPIRWNVGEEGSLVNLTSASNNNQIQVQMSREGNLNFDVQQDQIQASGSRQGDLVEVSVNQFPLALLDPFIPEDYPRNLEGLFNAQITGNLAQRSLQGQLDLESLRLSDIEAEQIRVDFAYENEQLTLANATLQLFDSTYEATGNIQLPFATPTAAPPQFNLQIETSNGRLQDIVSTFKWRTWEDVVQRGFRLPPLGPAAVLDANAVDVSQLSLFQQLQVYLQILQQRREAEAQQTKRPLPPPPSLRGEFEAAVQISGTLTDPQILVSLNGSNWSAEEFQLDTVQVSGELLQDSLQLNPLRIQTGERAAAFTGILGLNQQEGQLTVEAFPLGLTQRFLPPDLELQGDLNTDLQLAGNLRDPQWQGSFSVVDTQVNGTDISEIGGDLAYDAGRWQLDTSIQITPELEPVTVEGSIPYQLPLATVAAQSPQVDLKLDIANKALDLINPFTDQAEWQAGDSQLQVRVRGTLQSLTAEGSLSFSEGVLQTAAIATPLQDLEGLITFDQSVLSVDNFRGTVGDGTATATGQLPLSSRGALAQREDFQPLIVEIQGATVEIPDLYQGRVEGSILVGGIVTRPLLGGDLRASRGTVRIPTGAAETVATDSAEAPPLTPEFFRPELSDLILAVGPRIEVFSPNLFNFQAEGELVVNGPPRDLEPEGTIFLRNGTIDLPLGSDFQLDRAHENRVTFEPKQGLDPYLDLRLFTRVTEITGEPIPTSGSNVSQTSGQTIEIAADVDGRASQLQSQESARQIVTLSSRPARTEDEIIALLGTSAVATLGTAAGLSQVAGQSALHSLGQQIGLDDVRIGPVIQVDTQAVSRSNVGFELELIKDLTRNLSISGRIPLTDPQPTRYSLRYSLSSATLLRLSTDLEGNNSARVDYSLRF
jgi:translocation and assembly module TamB